MRRDFQFHILLALAAIPAGVALMAAPDYIEILREEPSPFFWGGLISTVGLIGTAISIARGEATEPRYGHERRMIALAGMIIFGLGFVGSAALYFWPMRPTDDAPYLARLAALGWTIKPSQRGIQFEVSSRPLPPMKESLIYFGSSNNLSIYFFRA